MLKKLKDTVQKAARFDPFGSIDSALQNQQSRIDEMEARIQTLTSVQEWYDIATRHFGVGVAVISRTRQVLWSNAFLTEMVGSTERGFCHAALCGLDTKCPSCAMDELLSGSIPKALYPMTLHDRNARPIAADATAMPMFDVGGVITGIIVLIAPKTESEKINPEVPAVAAGIIPADEPPALPRAADISPGPAFGGQETTSCPVNMNTIIEEYLTSPKILRLYADYPYVCFTNNLAIDLAGIAGSPVKLGKCLTTLLSAAAEGVNGIGEVHIRTRNVRPDDPKIAEHALPAGEYIAIRISETGEPANTSGKDDTPPSGRPGLDSVKSIAREHQGLLVSSHIAGRGVAHTLYLPVRLFNSESTPHAVPSQQAGSGRTILVIDDMTDQRALAATILKQLGYHVISVRSGEEAIGHLGKEPVDLVLLNLIMFGMDGLETYREIMKIKPAQKILLVSGYSVNTKLRQTREIQACPFIKKPYRLDVLGPAVARELGLEPEKKEPYHPSSSSRKFPPL